MRITQTMMTNRMLLNINRNMSYIDTLNTQKATGKQILFPSDNPILASRALKFRTTVAETQQYQRNASQGLSWMEVTEKAYNNVNSIMKTIREKCEEAASDAKTIEDRKALINNIRQLVNQIGSEMNVTYAGRYVFSGYRTDQPLVYETSQPDLSYSILQNFTVGDIQNTESYQKIGLTGEPQVHNVNILKLAYKNMGSISIPGYTVNTINLNSTAPDPYIVTNPDEINYIPETGELVLGKNVVAKFNDQPSGLELPTISIAPKPANSTNANLNGFFDDDYRNYETAYNTYSSQLTTYNEQLQKYTDANLQYEKDYETYQALNKQYEIDRITNSRANRPTAPEPPKMPIEPQMPAPPNPEDRGNYATYIADFSTYQTSFGTYQNDFGLYLDNGFGTSYKDYQNKYGTYLDQYANPSVAEPTAPVEVPYNVTPASGSPDLFSGGTTNDYLLDPAKAVDPAYLADYNDYMNKYKANAIDVENFVENYDALAKQYNELSEENKGGLKVQYIKTGFTKGELNPITNFYSIDMNSGSNYSTTKDNQSFEYEFGVNTRININSLGNHVFTDKMYADLLQLCDLVDNVQLSTEDQLTQFFESAAGGGLSGDELKKRVADQLTLESQKIAGVLQDRFSDMLGMVDKHVAAISREQTDLGSRMNRIDLIQNRLAEDEISYSKLQSENEDANLIEVQMKLSTAEAVYMASLQAGAKITQATLANYI